MKEPRARISRVGLSLVAVYVAWALWYAGRTVLAWTPSSTFGGLVIAVPGFPWSFGLGAVHGIADPRVLTLCWAVNAVIVYWWGAVLERWVRPEIVRRSEG